MFITGPEVIKTVTLEEVVTAEELGGAATTHTSRSRPSRDWSPARE